MNILNRLFAAATITATTLALSACFGGGDDEPVQTSSSTDVPDAAAASGGGFVAYLLSLPATDETSEPLVVKENLTVPADETGEPQPLT